MDALYCQQIGFPYNDSGYVFRQDDGSPIHPDTISKWFAKFLDRSELPKIRLHDLRGSHASVLIAAGVDVLTVAARLGDDPQTIFKHYAQARKEADANAAAIWAEQVGHPNFLDVDPHNPDNAKKR